MSRALALAVLLLAAAAVAPPLASAAGVDSIPGAKEFADAGSSGTKQFADAGSSGAKQFADAGSATKSVATMAVGADPKPAPSGGMPADPAPDARG